MEASVLTVSVVRQQDSPLWLPVCFYRGDGDEARLTGVLPENATEPNVTALRVGWAHAAWAKPTCRFPPAFHGGQDLTCVRQTGAHREDGTCPSVLHLRQRAKPYHPAAWWSPRRQTRHKLTDSPGETPRPEDTAPR